MKCFLLLLYVLLGFQLLSASAQSVSDGAICPSTTLTPALNHSVLYNQSLFSEEPKTSKPSNGTWYVTDDHRQCEINLKKATYKYETLDKRMLKYLDFVGDLHRNYGLTISVLQNQLQTQINELNLKNTKNKENLQEIEMLNINLTEAKTNITSLNTALKSTTVTNLDLLQKIEKLTQESTKNEENLKKIEMFETRLTEANNEANTTISNLTSSLNIIVVKNTNLQQEIDDLKEEIMKLNKQQTVITRPGATDGSANQDTRCETARAVVAHSLQRQTVCE